jgi:hypothetical protein
MARANWRVKSPVVFQKQWQASKLGLDPCWDLNHTETRRVTTTTGTTTTTFSISSSTVVPFQRFGALGRAIVHHDHVGHVQIKVLRERHKVVVFFIPVDAPRHNVIVKTQRPISCLLFVRFKRCHNVGIFIAAEQTHEYASTL